jgi:hypothetical protein
MTITERYNDLAGKYRYVVAVDSTLLIPLKYAIPTSDATILMDAQIVYDRIQEQAEKDSWTPINFDL